MDQREMMDAHVFARMYLDGWTVTWATDADGDCAGCGTRLGSRAHVFHGAWGEFCSYCFTQTARAGIRTEPEPEVSDWAEIRMDVLKETHRDTVRELDELRNELQLARIRHEDDIRRISDAINEEANRRKWCEDFDEFVETLNADLHMPLKVREREFEVTMEIREVVSIMVTATSEEHAHEAAEEQIPHEHFPLFPENPEYHLIHVEMSDDNPL